MQDVLLYVLYDKSRFSTPEICAHVGVCIGRSVGTSATKKYIQVIPSEYSRYTLFRQSYYGLFPELALYRFLAFLEPPDARKRVETLPQGSTSAQNGKNLDLDARGARKGHFKSG